MWSFLLLLTWLQPVCFRRVPVWIQRPNSINAWQAVTCLFKILTHVTVHITQVQCEAGCQEPHQPGRG